MAPSVDNEWLVPRTALQTGKKPLGRHGSKWFYNVGSTEMIFNLKATKEEQSIEALQLIPMKFKYFLL